jgi:hypothetical protein
MGLRAIALAEPRKRTANPVNNAANRLLLHLHEVNVFRVPQWLAKEQLVDGRAAAKRELASKFITVEKIAQRAGDNQVLLDLSLIGPWSFGGPLLNMGDGYQASISTGTFTMSFQSAFRSSDPASSGTMGLTDGSSDLNDLALLAKSLSAFACRECPKCSRR